MSFLSTVAASIRPPDHRPIRQIEEEILDELEFHVEMRTLDNVHAGMAPVEARKNALSRFGDFRRIHKACRRTLLGERIMLQRLQAVLTVVLLGAVIYMGVQFYGWQRANHAAMTRVMQTLEKMAETPAGDASAPAVPLAEAYSAGPPVVVDTVPATGDTEVDPSLTEIRVTFSKEMMDQSWSWSQTSDVTFPETTGEPYYLADGKTCVLPVKLKPGTGYAIWLNSDKFGNFKDEQGRSAVPHFLRFQTRP